MDSNRQAPLSMEFSKKNTEVGFHSLLQGIFPTQELSPASCTAGRFFTNWATGDSCVHIPFHILSFFFMAYNRMLDIIPCAIQEDLIYPSYI